MAIVTQAIPKIMSQMMPGMMRNDSTEKTTKTPRMSTSEHEENLKDKLQIIRQSEVESEFSCAKP